MPDSLAASGRPVLRSLCRFVLVVVAALCSVQASAQTRLVTIGAGSVGGVYYPAAGVLCRLLNQDRPRHGLRCAVEVSDGSVENATNLLNGGIDIGIVQSDIQSDAFNGQGRFQDIEQGKRLRALFSLHAEPVTIVTRLDANVQGFAGLAGRRVNVGETGSGTLATMSLLMEAFGMKGSDLARQFNLTAAEAAVALCENRIDAFVYVVGHPNRTIQEASESCAVRFVSVDGPPVDRLLATHKYFSRAVIAPGTYVGQEQEVVSLGVRASVVTTDALNDAIAYEVTRAAFADVDAMRELHPAFRHLTRQGMLQGNTAAYHPGALRYFKEAGLTP